MTGHRKLLIIDDDPVITSVYEWHFRADGFNDVRIARTGEGGLRAVREFIPDAVLLDLDVPGIDGVDWLDAVRRESRFALLPVVVLTAGAIGWPGRADRHLGVSLMFKAGAAPGHVVDAIHAAIEASCRRTPRLMA